MNENQHIIIDATGLSEEQYFELVFNRGRDYLSIVLFPGNKIAQQCMAGNGLFWKWWKHQWNNRDNIWVSALIDLAIHNDLTQDCESYHSDYICQLHNVHNIVGKPNRFVMTSFRDAASKRVIIESSQKIKQITWR